MRLEHYNLTCPNWVLKQIAIFPGDVNNSTQESFLYGPYDTILHYLFPPNEYFMAAVSTIHDWSTDTIFIVESNTQTPIYCVEIKPPGHLNELSEREQADTQTRDSTQELITKLHGVSALSVRLASYQYDA